MYCMSYKNFDLMITELYEELKQVNHSTKNDFYIPEAKITKKPTRLDWINFFDFLKKINRSPQHFIKFLKHERKIDGDLVGTVLIIQGKYRKEDVSKIMVEYTNKFCLCPICKSYNTNLLKDAIIKKEKISCLKCKSQTFI